jgi:tRNA-specific 2-thiouridylase
MVYFEDSFLKKGDTVVVAMSGGVDSSVVAAMMVEHGYQVIGMTLQLYDQGQFFKKKGACCAGQDIYDARRVADKMNFSHYILDYESVFKEQVIDSFVDDYLKGSTPIPCVKCNQKVKFKDLLKASKDLGAKALMTGHYVQRIQHDHEAQLHRAHDFKKDQSYFLFTTTQEQLDYLRFPLGGLSKDQTRELAKRYDLPVADKPDSQDICFVPFGDYTKVIEKFRPGALEEGDIVDLDGKILGRHPGIIHFTVGQRKGLQISYSYPLYVVRLDPNLHQVVVGPKEALAVNNIQLNDVNWLTHLDDFDCHVKVRSVHQPVPAHVQKTETGAVVTFDSPEYGVSSGQACVFYEVTRVLGGGWIVS